MSKAATVEKRIVERDVVLKDVLSHGNRANQCERNLATLRERQVKLKKERMAAGSSEEKSRISKEMKANQARIDQTEGVRSRAAWDAKKATRRYERAERNIETAVRKLPFETQRTAARQRSIDSKVDIHLESAGYTKSPRTRENMRTAITFMEHPNHPQARATVNRDRARPLDVQGFARTADLNGRVKVARFQTGETVKRTSTQAERKPGPYLSKPSATPDQVGVNDKGRHGRKKHSQKYDPQGVPVLVSKSRPTVDHWSNRKQAYFAGGKGTQYWVRSSDRAKFRKLHSGRKRRPESEKPRVSQRAQQIREQATERKGEGRRERRKQAGDRARDAQTSARRAANALRNKHRESQTPRLQKSRTRKRSR